MMARALRERRDQRPSVLCVVRFLVRFALTAGPVKRSLMRRPLTSPARFRCDSTRVSPRQWFVQWVETRIRAPENATGSIPIPDYQQQGITSDELEGGSDLDDAAVCTTARWVRSLLAGGFLLTLSTRSL